MTSTNPIYCLSQIYPTDFGVHIANYLTTSEYHNTLLISKIFWSNQPNYGYRDALRSNFLYSIERSHQNQTYRAHLIDCLKKQEALLKAVGSLFFSQKKGCSLFFLQKKGGSLRYEQVIPYSKRYLLFVPADRRASISYDLSSLHFRNENASSVVFNSTWQVFSYKATLHFVHLQTKHQTYKTCQGPIQAMLFTHECLVVIQQAPFPFSMTTSQKNNLDILTINIKEGDPVPVLLSTSAGFALRELNKITFWKLEKATPSISLSLTGILNTSTSPLDVWSYQGNVMTYCDDTDLIQIWDAETLQELRRRTLPNHCLSLKLMDKYLIHLGPHLLIWQLSDLNQGDMTEWNPVHVIENTIIQQGWKVSVPDQTTDLNLGNTYQQTLQQPLFHKDSIMQVIGELSNNRLLLMLTAQDFQHHAFVFVDLTHPRQPILKYLSFEWSRASETPLDFASLYLGNYKDPNQWLQREQDLRWQGKYLKKYLDRQTLSSLACVFSGFLQEFLFIRSHFYLFNREKPSNVSWKDFVDACSRLDTQLTQVFSLHLKTAILHQTSVKYDGSKHVLITNKHPTKHFLYDCDSLALTECRYTEIRYDCLTQYTLFATATSLTVFDRNGKKMPSPTFTGTTHSMVLSTGILVLSTQDPPQLLAWEIGTNCPMQKIPFTKRLLKLIPTSSGFAVLTAQRVECWTWDRANALSACYTGAITLSSAHTDVESYQDLLITHGRRKKEVHLWDPTTCQLRRTLLLPIETWIVKMTADSLVGFSPRQIFFYSLSDLKNSDPNLHAKHILKNANYNCILGQLGDNTLLVSLISYYTSTLASIDCLQGSIRTHVTLS